jgi:hypothetical protein
MLWQIKYLTSKLSFLGFELPQLFHPLRNTANILGFAQIVKEATSGDTRYNPFNILPAR